MGSAIVGSARADLYFGSGDEASEAAGRVRQAGRFAMPLPLELDPWRRALVCRCRFQGRQQ
jgi:hypothetical protein